MTGSRWIGWAAALLLLNACGAEGGVAAGDDEVDVIRVSAMTDEEKALYALTAAGFSLDEVVPFEEGYLVDGDIYVRTSDLVARTNLAVEKGYWCGQNQYRLLNSNTSCFFNPIQANMSTGIALVYDEIDPSVVLHEAFLAASLHWSQAHDHRGRGTDVYIDGGVEHKQPSFFNITIRARDLGPDKPVGAAEWPFLGNWGVEPGRTITINTNQAYWGIVYNTAALTKVALHELGHTLGFAHPESYGGAGNNFEHISGTSSGTSYSTVMHEYGVNVADPALYYDDNRSLVAMYPGTSDLPATNGDDFCKASTGFGMRNGCDVGEGDCDSENTSAECKADLECRRNVGAKWELPSNYDVCEKPASCAAYEGDDDNYCNDIHCPCGPLEGDCDLDSQCGGRLICGHDRGLAAGKSAAWDLCILPPIDGCPTFASPGIEFCSTSCPCTLGEGDCDSDDECRGDLVCVTAGSALGYTGAHATWQFCVSPEF